MGKAPLYGSQIPVNFDIIVYATSGKNMGSALDM